ncbi:MAG: hypothetical protein ACE5Q6_15280, partial [Dehalococcoidia bacterium]
MRNIMLHSKRHILWVLLSLCICAVTLVAAGSIGGDGDPEPEEVNVILKEIINRVETDRPRHLAARGTNFLPARIGQELVPGDGIKTFENSESRVDIAVREFTRITRTTPNTVWRLGQFALDGATIIELNQGKLFLFDEGFQQGQPNVNVVTPVGT